MTIAIYPGSFDPVTNGHLDILARIVGLFDEVVVAVLNNPDKRPLFSADERVDLLRGVTAVYQNVVVDSFTGLLADYAKTKGAGAIVRGLRETGDFENELKMAQMNRSLYEPAVTLFIPTNPAYSYVSSSLVKQVAVFGGDITKFVPAQVASAMSERLQSQSE